MLTDKEVRAARPRAKGYYLRDGKSLYCRVRKTSDGASKVWQFFFRWNGKTERFSLGAFPDVPLAEARPRRDAARDELSADPPRHPVIELKRREQEALAKMHADAAEKSVHELFDDWQEVYLAKNRKDGGAECRAVFELDVFSVVGNLKAREIKRHHVAGLIGRPLKRGARRRANILLAMLKQFFSQALVRGFIDADPTAGFTRQHAGGKEAPRTRALTVPEIRQLAEKLPNSGLAETQQAAIKLLLATGARVGELNKSTWDEFDIDAGTWNIPAVHTKESREHFVHLSDFAKEQLTILRRFRGKGGHVLLSVKSKTPIEDKALTKAVRDRQRDVPHKGRSTRYAGTLKLSGGDWCIHDLRRTMATRMGDLGILPHIVEKCLSHKMVGVMAVYNHQDYLPERKAAFSAWGDQLQRLFSSGSGNIIELAPARVARNG
jgi:integrase